MGMGIVLDFVVAGSPLDGGRVQLIASKHLTYAELTAEYEHQDIFWDTLEPVLQLRTSAVYSLTTRMGRVVIIQADDYLAAFRALAEMWAEGGWRGSPAGQIEPPHHALPAAGQDRPAASQPRELPGPAGRCEDCGSHPAVRCADPDCDQDVIDLIYSDDPREVPGG